MKQRVQAILLIIWIIIIFVLTGYPSLETPKIEEIPVDKIYHFIIFFILGLLTIRLLITKYFYLLGCSVVLISELQQLFIPGRDFEIFDIIAGITGLISVYFIFKVRRHIKDGLSKT